MLWLLFEIFLKNTEKVKVSPKKHFRCNQLEVVRDISISQIPRTLYVFERETVSNYGEDQEEQFEIVQVSAEDTIDNDSISVAGWKEWEITVFTGTNRIVKKKQQTNRQACRATSGVTKGTNAKINAFTSC